MKYIFYLLVLFLPFFAFAQVEPKIHPAQIGAYGAVSGQVLYFDGTNWGGSTIASGSISWPLLAPASTTPNYSFQTSTRTGMFYTDAVTPTLVIKGEDDIGTYTGTSILIESGRSDAGGQLTMRGGEATLDEERGGTFLLEGGPSTGVDGEGGELFLRGGPGTYGGALVLAGGEGTFSGGSVIISGGGSTGSGGGGGVIIRSNQNATGIQGQLVLQTGSTGLLEPVIFNSAGLQYKSLTTTQRNALTGVTAGRVLYNGTLNKLQHSNGTTWETILTDLSTAGGDVTGTFDNLQIAANAVGNTEIANASVTNVKISDNAVGTSKIISGSVTGIKVASGGANNGEFYAYGGAGVGWVPSPAGGDVTGTVTNLQLAQMGATSGQFLKWSGTDWIPDNISGGSSLPSGVDKQTLYYNGTTLTVNSFLQNDGTNGIGVGGVPVVNDWIHSYGRVTVDAPIISKASGANCNFRLDNTVSGLTWFWYGNDDGTLSVQADATRILTADNVKKQISIRNLKTEKAIYTDLFTTSATSYQITGLDSEVRLSPGSALGSIALPEIVTGTPSTNQVNAGFVLYLNFSSTIATSVSRSGTSDLIEQNMAIGNSTSITNQANYVFAHRIVAVDANTWVIY